MKKMIASIVMLFALSACGGGNTYESTDELIPVVSDVAVSCTGNGATETVYSASSEDCVFDESTGEGFYTVSIYSSEEQAEESRVYLRDMNPDPYYVWGTNWSIMVRDEATANKLAERLDGEVDAPQFSVQ